MTPLHIHFIWNSIPHIVEIDDFDYSISIVWRKTNGHYTPLDDLEPDLEDVIDRLCQHYNPE